MSGVIQRLRGRNNEGILAAIIIVLVVAMSLVNHDFFSLSTLYSLVRDNLVQMVFAIGVLIVIVSGGIDVSFTAIAIVAAYSAVKVAQQGSMWESAIVIIVVALMIGAALGSINGFIISQFKLPTLIVTLGTQGIFRGLLLAYIGSKYIANLPESLDQLSTANLTSASRGNVTTQLHIFVIPVVLLCILAAWILNRTMFGRSLYALGADVESARRAGISVKRVQLYVYTIVGVISAIGGFMYVVMARNAKPQDIVGTELDVIAAVVLGGASITGGRGSVTGTVMGVFLIGLISNSLIMLGVPSTWQRAAVGILLLGGLSAQAIASARKRPSHITLLDEAGVIA